MLSLKLLRGAETAEGVRLVTQVPPDQARFVIGRDPACDWPIPDKALALSARHCEIVRVEGRQVLHDLSTNGTFLNGARERLPADHVLRHGDRIAMGSYLIEVTVVPDSGAAQPAKPAGMAAPALRRGGDPAAMVGADWQQAAAPARSGGSGADVKTGFTRISKPPPKDAMAASAAAAAAAAADASAANENVAVALAATRPDVALVAPALAREPVRRAPPGTTDVLQRLAGGLGVPVEALGVTDPAVAAERVARLLRVSVLALHRQMSEQTRHLREMGSRAPQALARSESAPLRLAPGPEEALAALLASSGEEGVAMLVRAHRELAQHSQRLLAAFGAAGARLGEQLAPATLERTAQGAGDADAARLWKIYGTLWTALGVGVGKSWPEGFGEAVTAYLAAAYDDPQLAEKPAR